MKHLKVDRRLLVSICALAAMIWKPEVAASAAAVAVALSAANSAQAILQRPKVD